MNKGTLYFPEIFEIIGKAETREKKIALLRKYSRTKGMNDILIMCYDPYVKWAVTRADIENLAYDHMDIPDYDLAPTNMFKEAKKLFNWTNLKRPMLTKAKVIRNITMRFSAMHHNEVELFKQIVDGDILEAGIDVDLVREAWPGLLSGAHVKESEPESEQVKSPETVVEPVVVVESVKENEQVIKLTASDELYDDMQEFHGVDKEEVDKMVSEMADPKPEGPPNEEVPEMELPMKKPKKKSTKGMKFYNNGKVTKRFADGEVPEGFVKGRHKKGKK